MIYSIETIPMVLFSKILSGCDLKQLSDEDLSEDDLNAVWDEIREEYKKHENNPLNNKINSLRIRLSKKSGEYAAIISALEALKYKKSTDMLEILKSYGYTITGDFREGLALINKQVLNLENYIQSIKKEIEDLVGDGGKDVSIYEIIIGLSVGLEIPLDTNKLTAIEYIYYSKALKNKIKALKDGRGSN